MLMRKSEERNPWKRGRTEKRKNASLFSLGQVGSLANCSTRGSQEASFCGRRVRFSLNASPSLS